MTLDESKHDNDVFIEAAGIPLVFDKELEQYLQDGTLDYNFPLKWFMSIPEVKKAE
ncbi:MAG: hypothetical protein GX133_00885 [Syntrophomonadaceae bacterium]|nr:hypothetical protein [Syntrophomonadaceae bacterium]